MRWVIDLDGVVWLGDQPIAGAAAAVARLRDRGDEVVFVTNNSSATVVEQEAKLARHRIGAEGAVATSASAAASLVDPGETVLVCGGPGVVEAVSARGARPVSVGDADVVVVGLDLGFDYARLAAAAAALRGGARLIGTNDDATFPTPSGLVPGAGSLLAAVATASGATPELAGKPHPAMVELLRRRLGDHGTLVGDRPDTDGRFARALGYRFALVLSGVTTEADLPVDPRPDEVAATLAEVIG